MTATTARLGICVGLALLAVPGSENGTAAESTELQVALRSLRSGDEYERQRAEAALLRVGPEALPPLIRTMEGDDDPVTRARAEALFRDLIDGVLAELEGESRALRLDRSELSSLRDRAEAAELRKQLSSTIEAWSRLDPPLSRIVEALLRLEALREKKRMLEASGAERLGDDEEAEIARLSEQRDAWRSERPELDEVEGPLLRLARLEATGAPGGPPTELQRMRMEDLESRIASREPRVQALEEEVLALGPAALNAWIARGVVRSGAISDHARALLERSFGESGPPPVPTEGEALEKVRYARSLLWKWELDRGGARESEAEKALQDHIDRVTADLESPVFVLSDRAATELYFLGDAGLSALEERIRDLGEAGRARHGFLLGLLRWRILPQTYERAGIDFSEYRGLDARERRRAVFDYARTAGDAAIPTLRKIVGCPECEPSLVVRIGAAKALAGLRDMWGFEHLLREHPDLTLTRPEVSRDLAIIQGVDQIRDKRYEAAVQTLEKVLDEFPFDFRANYHIAFAYLLLKDYDKAIRHFEIAKRINPNDQLTLYNLACAYALSGKRTEALRELEASVEAGFDDADHIRQDPDLESLRGDPRFQRLIDRIERAAASDDR